MGKENQIQTVGIELVKTVGGFMAGRMAVIAGEKALKVVEETDAKKKKFKEVGVGVGVAAVGTIITLKAPKEFASVGAGMTTAGVISAMSPFGKEDKGFIPVLHGVYDEDGNYIEVNSELNALSETEAQQAEREFKEFEEEENNELNALSELEEELEEEELNGTPQETLN